MAGRMASRTTRHHGKKPGNQNERTGVTTGTSKTALPGATTATSATPNERMPNTHAGLLTVTRRIALLASLGALASCSSLIERSAPPPNKVFPGVRLDFDIATVSGGHWDGPGTQPFRCVWATIDLPFSLAFDTVMLPWDATMAWSAGHAGEKAPKRAELAEREKLPVAGADGGD